MCCVCGCGCGCDRASLFFLLCAGAVVVCVFLPFLPIFISINSYVQAISKKGFKKQSTWEFDMSLNQIATNENGKYFRTEVPCR